MILVVCLMNYEIYNKVIITTVCHIMCQSHVQSGGLEVVLGFDDGYT